MRLDGQGFSCGPHEKKKKDRKGNSGGFLACFLTIKTLGMLYRSVLILLSLTCLKYGGFFILMDVS